jgi:hypothetical protein
MLIAIHDDEKKEILGLTVYCITHNIKYSKHIYCNDLVTNKHNRSSGVGRYLINYVKRKEKNEELIN